MTFKRIVAFDPGGTTGWATWEAFRFYNAIDDIYEYHDQSFNCGYLGPELHHQALYDFMEDRIVEETMFVTESFEFRNKHRDNVELISREYIGVMRLVSQQRAIPLIQQTAAEGKVEGRTDAFTTKKNLVALGLWQPGTEWKHSMDAYGHLLYYMVHHNICRNDLLLKGWKNV